MDFPSMANRFSSMGMHGSSTQGYCVGPSNPVAGSFIVNYNSFAADLFYDVLMQNSLMVFAGTPLLKRRSSAIFPAWQAKLKPSQARKNNFNLKFSHFQKQKRYSTLCYNLTKCVIRGFFIRSVQTLSKTRYVQAFCSHSTGVEKYVGTFLAVQPMYA